jgi:arabinose-5-phosphate isomerase
MIPKKPPVIEEKEAILQSAKNVFKIESEAIAALSNRLTDEFVAVVNLIDRRSGTVIVTGIGKSGLIGKKIAATFSSIGIPAIFLHAAEGSHGDLGIVSKDNVILAISNSGETEEILKILPFVNRIGAILVGLTGNLESTLAKRSDHVLDTGVVREACPLDLAPTASTATALAMGDAIAVALINKKGIQKEDFAQNHPGGNLGKRLLTTVGDLMHSGDEIPSVDMEADIFAVLSEMSQKSLGTTAVLDANNYIIGIVTDGDIRRLIESKKDILGARAKEMMTKNPKTINKKNLATKAVQIMEKHTISSLIVSEDQGTIDGIIHLQDLLKAGIV